MHECVKNYVVSFKEIILIHMSIRRIATNKSIALDYFPFEILFCVKHFFK